MFCNLLHKLLFYLLRDTNNILLFSPKQINLMFYYFQDVYQKNQLGTRLNTRDDPRKKHNPWKSKCNEHQGNCSEPLSGGFWGHSSLRTFFDSIDHLDWLKIDLNRAEINSEWKYTYTMLKLRVKQVTYKSKI